MMNHLDYFRDMISDKKHGVHNGVYSVCSSNHHVIAAAMDIAKKNSHPVLIESTCNQVNQFGGYSGMRPADFRSMVFAVAAGEDFPREEIILGGDHLGPNPWKAESSDSAMEKAYDLVREYVRAGYAKIHLDASMLLNDDTPDGCGALDPKMAALRSAHLCKAAEREFLEYRLENPGAIPPVYVIGTEVPVPGGASVKGLLNPEVTGVENLKETIGLCREYFLKFDLEDAWDRVIAVVVQPGVEFSNTEVFGYRRNEANSALKDEIRGWRNLVFEAHSTDYQPRGGLRNLVEDGTGILKVGPALTFAFREAVMNLHAMEKALRSIKKFGRCSKITEVVEKTMTDNDMYWRDYYSGGEYEKEYFRKYGLSDRVRYYWNYSQVKKSLDLLFHNLDSVELPMPLISQYMPLQYRAVRDEGLNPSCSGLIRHHIRNTLEDYEYAVLKK